MKKKEHTIWFNQTFSTLYPLLDVIRQDFLSACFPIKILTSSRNPNVIYQNNSDRFLVEPDCDFPTYLEWCKKICKEYQVDVFYPKRYMKELSNYRTTFGKTWDNSYGGILSTFDPLFEKELYVRYADRTFF